MLTFIIRRLLLSAFIIILVSMFAFSIMHILPGDPVVIALGDGASEEVVQKHRERLNLDKPLPVQYWLWMKGAVKGDFGQSILYNENVGQLVKEKLPITLWIGLPAMFFSVLFGILLGIISAKKSGSWIDQSISFTASIGLGTPLFWVAILGVYVFGLELGILPLQGYTSPTDDFGDYVYKAILPVFCISIGYVAIIARQTRSNMLEVINQDYIRTARANGLPEHRVIFRHGLKNALIPVITIVGLQMRIVVGGSVIIERIFNIPGIGALLMRSVTNRDYLIVQACILIITLVTVLLNLLVDLAYGAIDPRIRKAWR